MNGEIARLQGDYSVSLNFFLQGIEEKDFYCHLFLSRIYIEPGLLNSYAQERSPQKTLDYLLNSFLEFGLFDKPFDSLSGLAFMIWLRSLEKREKLIYKGIVIDLF